MHKIEIQTFYIENRNPHDESLAREIAEIGQECFPARRSEGEIGIKLVGRPYKDGKVVQKTFFFRKEETE